MLPRTSDVAQDVRGFKPSFMRRTPSDENEPASHLRHRADLPGCHRKALHEIVHLPLEPPAASGLVDNGPVGWRQQQNGQGERGGEYGHCLAFLGLLVGLALRQERHLRLLHLGAEAVEPVMQHSPRLRAASPRRTREAVLHAPPLGQQRNPDLLRGDRLQQLGSPMLLRIVGSQHSQAGCSRVQLAQRRLSVL